MNDGLIRRSTLSATVEGAVVEYLETMGDQQVSGLYDMVLSEVEGPLLSCILQHTGNNQSRAAQMLGLNRGTLRKKMRRYRLL